MPIYLRLMILILLFVLVGCSSSRGVYHPVAEGQTLYRISRAYGLEPEYLARVNGVTDPTQLKAGQRLFVPGAARVQTVPATVPGKASEAPAAETTRTKPATSSDDKKSGIANSAQTQPASRTAQKPPPPTKKKFVYPIRGKIVKNFGEQSGQINRGVEFSAALNTPIVSAAAGRVIYSGNGVKGYGNLLILKHEDSFYTVYGFNAKNLVSSGTYVSKGQKIALCGTPPGGGTPRLHFEIRYGKEAVNPIFYLP